MTEGHIVVGTVFDEASLISAISENAKIALEGIGSFLIRNVRARRCLGHHWETGLEKALFWRLMVCILLLLDITLQSISTTDSDIHVITLNC